jgi:hypothetical protein
VQWDIVEVTNEAMVSDEGLLQFYTFSVVSSVQCALCNAVLEIDWINLSAASMPVLSTSLDLSLACEAYTNHHTTHIEAFAAFARVTQVPGGKRMPPIQAGVLRPEPGTYLSPLLHAGCTRHYSVPARDILPSLLYLCSRILKDCAEFANTITQHS